MKNLTIKITAMLMAVFFLTVNISADDVNADDGETENIYVGGGTEENKWSTVIDSRGNYDYPDGLRVYIADASTGTPISSVIDITNYQIGTHVRSGYNGRKFTKYDYLHGVTLTISSGSYNYKLIDTYPELLPRVVYSSVGSGRIELLKNWFLNPYYGEWVLSQLGVNVDTMRELTAAGKPKYKLVFEPILYFYLNSNLYGLTATEVALLNIQTSNAVSYNLGSALMLQNLPLSVFLERDEFEGANRIPAWGGSTTSPASNDSIRQYLGIGTVTYAGEPPIAEPGTTDLSFPTDTWVVTSFKLNNVKRSDGSWVGDESLTLNNYATAAITVNGTTYNIRFICIPSGEEQLVWAKWKTPSTPQNLTATATTDKGYWYNPNNDSIDNLYVSSISANINVYSADTENPPPDPTLDDTAASIGYNAVSASNNKNSMLASGTDTNSWIVWSNTFRHNRTYTQTYTATDHSPDYPTGDTYDDSTGTYTGRTVVGGGSYTYNVPILTDPPSYYERTDYWVTVQFDEYNYGFSKRIYTAEIMTTDVEITPDSHCPTDYTYNYNTYMKSGYGINAEVEPYIKITVYNESDDTTTTSTFYSATSTEYAAAPQFVSTFFPEFNYDTYNRLLDYYGGKYVFKKNKYSTYNSRTHYTPWWFPDNTNYEIISLCDYAYTPAGKLEAYKVSNPIVIEENLMDDWHVAYSR